MKTYFRWVLLIGLLSLSLVFPLAAQEKSYFPTTDWRTSTPEEQGMDSVALADFIEQLPKTFNVDSLMVIRNGYVVAEAYWQPFQREMKHEMMSASKSVISALVGIALDKGYIKSIDQKVLDFFPGVDVKNLDDNKRMMTLRNLLTMTSGFDCEISLGTDPIVGEGIGLAGSIFTTNPDATQATLSWKMADKPGTTWRYCQINVYLLSAILSKTTGMDTLAFAKQYLFTPMGITDVRWNASTEGVALGYAGLMLNTGDMGKIGYLYLNNGHWDDKQVVPADWIKESTKNYSPQKPWDSPVGGYGYLWWTYHAPSGDFIEANGAYFQHIDISSEKKLVVVNTAEDMGNAYMENFNNPTFMEAIFKTVKSDQPLPPNPKGVTRLEAAVKAAANPAPQHVDALPSLAANVTGKTYQLSASNLLLADIDVLRMPKKDWAMTTLGLDFGQNEATLRLKTENGVDLKLLVGLDGNYRMTPSDMGTLAARGSWLNDKVFALYVRRVEQGPVLKYTLTFSDKGFTATAESARPGDGFAPDPITFTANMLP